MIDNEDKDTKTDDTDDSSHEVGLEAAATDDTSESASLQGEEGSEGQIDTNNASVSFDDDSKDDPSVHDNDQNTQNSANKDLSKVLDNLDDFIEGTGEMLVWKEELKLLTLDAVLNLPYYELWRTESNDWFRRAVILKARRRKLEKKGA